jgi:hypothetical protein
LEGSLFFRTTTNGWKTYGDYLAEYTCTRKRGQLFDQTWCLVFQGIPRSKELWFAVDFSECPPSKLYRDMWWGRLDPEDRGYEANTYKSLWDNNGGWNYNNSDQYHWIPVLIENNAFFLNDDSIQPYYRLDTWVSSSQ